MNSMHIKAMDKVGSIYCPGTDALPSFSEIGVAQYLNKMTANIPANDLKDLKLLLSVLYFLPSFLVKALLWLVEIDLPWPGVIGVNFRKIRFGLRGLSFSLYYSGLKASDYTGKTPDQIITESTSPSLGKS